jgi:hypothetical protein
MTGHFLENQYTAGDLLLRTAFAECFWNKFVCPDYGTYCARENIVSAIS